MLRKVLVSTRSGLLSTRRFSADVRPQFLVNPDTGFLPRKDPVAVLPSEFTPLEILLQNMPVKKVDGTPGLLAQNKFGEESAKIPDYTDKIEKIEDTGILSALFRDYTFWASSYLLEPCHHNMIAAGDTHSFGLGRQVLPLNISSPLLLLSEKLGAKPFMEYALSYALYNWKKVNESGAVTYDNLQLVRSFSGEESESGFILVHVSMVAHTKDIVKYCLEILEHARNTDRNAFNNALRNYQQTMRKINMEMDTMWKRSKPEDYEKFRTFIMGIKGQPMFPNGVHYERRDPQTGEVKQMGPFQFRGESGANDSIIPTCDNLLQLTENMPNNPLTEILKDFRTYRPVQHNTWLTFVQENAKLLGIKKFALENSESSFLYLTILDEVRDFRNRHWNFTKEYILRRTLHPVATGGSPIVTWLPNQLSVVLQGMEEVVPMVNPKDLDSISRIRYEEISKFVITQRAYLHREVDKLKEERNA